MTLSPFFEELKSAYDAELDDLLTDSAGHDVLAQRLRLKRSQLAQLLPMIEYSPEMVAVAFHGGMEFSSVAVMRDLALRDPEELPSWDLLSESVDLQPWAAELAKIALTDPNGERFLVVTACLEFLHGGSRSSPEAAHRQQGDDGRDDDEQFGLDQDSDSDVDLEEAGADWLAEQGFDRKDRNSGDS